MNKIKRLALTESIIRLLKAEASANEALHVLGVCASFYLHNLPQAQRRDDFESWVHQLYEAEFALQRHFGDNNFDSQELSN